MSVEGIPRRASQLTIQDRPVHPPRPPRKSHLLITRYLVYGHLPNADL